MQPYYVPKRWSNLLLLLLQLVSLHCWLYASTIQRSSVILAICSAQLHFTVAILSLTSKTCVLFNRLICHFVSKRNYKHFSMALWATVNLFDMIVPLLPTIDPCFVPKNIMLETSNHARDIHSSL